MIKSLMMNRFNNVNQFTDKWLPQHSFNWLLNKLRWHEEMALHKSDAPGLRTEAFSLETEALSLGTEAFGLGTEALSLGTEALGSGTEALGLRSEALGSGTEALS
jgi:hypothetical protein